MKLLPRLCAFLIAAICPIYPAANTVSVKNFGAKGDGVTKDTLAIQRAMDAAGQQGGGTVMVPPGRYLSGTIHLKSRVTLYLDNGAIILASPDNANFDPYETLPYPTPDDRETTYFHYALLAGENVENIAILGQGTIDGNRPVRGGAQADCAEALQARDDRRHHHPSRPELLHQPAGNRLRAY
jgi:polygalacturonase